MKMLGLDPAEFAVIKNFNAFRETYARKTVSELRSIAATISKKIPDDGGLRGPMPRKDGLVNFIVMEYPPISCV